MILSNLQSQTYYSEYEALSKSFTDKPYKITKKITDSLLNEASIENRYADIAAITHDFALISYYNNVFSDAIFYGELSLKNKRKLQQFDKDYAAILYRVGIFHYRNSSFETAINYYDEATKHNLDPVRTALAYCEIATCYYLLNNYHKSVNFHKKGISELEKLKEYDKLPREYINLSSTYKDIETRESLKLMLEILNKTKNLELYKVLKTSDHLNLNIAFANYYSYKFNYNFNKSRYYSIKNLELSLKNNRDDITCINYINLANIYNLQRLDSAKYFIKKAINYCSDTESLSKSYFQKGDYYNNKKEYLNALNNIQKGINLLIDLDKDYNSSLSFNELTISEDKDYLLFMLHEKIKLLRKQKETELALQHILASDSLIDHIQRETSNTTKLHWRTKASEIYTQGAEICYKLNQPETAFYLSEKGKALLLTESVLQNTKYTKLPDSISNIELELRGKTVIDNSKEEIFEAELRYEHFIDSITQEFPVHFKKLDVQKTTTLKDVQKKLDANTIIISYLWPNEDSDISSVYALFIDRKAIKFVNIGNAKTIANDINEYKRLISKPFSTVKDKTNFISNAHQLYETLFYTKPNTYQINEKDLIIIPDGELHNIPFEALITDSTSESYLIESNTVSYAYSLSFSQHNNSIARKASNDFIGYAPRIFNPKLNLSALANTNSELNDISEIIDGDILVKEKATKSSFLKKTKDYKIIHLATHANANEDPWIAFKDEKINLNELYAYKNNAELTVLSACETSIGEIANGEGVMSLARGFFYSGSNAVVSSLWNANDKSTAFIMKDFYKNLKKGKSKSVSLRNAKLKYLESNSLSETSPYYWSSFILIGNTDKIDFQNQSSPTYYIIIGFIALTIFLLYFKFKKK